MQEDRSPHSPKSVSNDPDKVLKPFGWAAFALTVAFFAVMPLFGPAAPLAVGVVMAAGLGAGAFRYGLREFKEGAKSKGAALMGLGALLMAPAVVAAALPTAAAASMAGIILACGLAIGAVFGGITAIRARRRAAAKAQASADRVPIVGNAKPAPSDSSVPDVSTPTESTGRQPTPPADQVSKNNTNGSPIPGAAGDLTGQTDADAKDRPD